MKVLVLGAGVVGVSTAYYLAQQGHQVTVLEREDGVAEETSFANAGQLSFGYSSPWAAPGIPAKATKWLFSQHAPLSIRPDGSLFQARWMMQMWSNCNAKRYAVNKERMLRLSAYSQKCMHKLLDDTNIEFEGRRKGTLQLFRTEKQMQAAARDVKALQEAGVAWELLERSGLAEAEPALAHVSYKLVGGLRTPDDETGDCRMFTLGLMAKAKQAGVEFKFGETIRALQTKHNKISAVQCLSGVLQADAYVVCMGPYSPLLLRGLVDIPVYPLKGYSITVDIVDEQRAPVSTILDETYKIALTRFKNRIRVGGMAEVVGYDLSLNKRREHTLEMVLNDLFGGSYAAKDLQLWTGLRPKTPDSTPIIGATKFDNLFLNTGHGTLGWTMACGSGQLIADIVSGKQPAIAYEDLAVQRYH